MNAEPLQRLVVFTSELNYPVRKGIREILEAFDSVTIRVLVHRPRKSVGRVIRNQVRNLKRHGPAWIPYQANDALSRLMPHAEPADGIGITRPGQRFEVDDLLRTGRVEMTVLPSVNGQEARHLLEDLRPDLGVALGAPILKPDVFTVPRLGTINLHKGKLPDYRGMPPAFWEISDGQSSVGCTVHRVDEKLDTGAIIVEATVPVEKYSTPEGLRIRLDAIGNRLVVEAIGNLAAGTEASREQYGQGRTNTRPPLRVERRLLNEIARREGTSGARRQIKDVVFDAYSATRHVARAIAPRRREPEVVVLLYHRVDDEFRDNVTIGVEQFDRQMAYLKRHWPVVPLRALVRGEVAYSGRAPLICITFDDGYRDNYDYAAPILLKNHLPATFFVSTNKLTSALPFEHDLQKFGHGLPNMSWDHVREMQREGLDFGSHTANHVNLGKSSPEKAWVEITDSRDTLRRELGHAEFLFAYPFGGERDITAEARDQVRQAGYACCCSAHGGRNTGGMDLFNIRRIGVNYNFSIAALRSRLNGWG
jgi:peptidoglycan/xylan/chitin deacetylase (PgdA/CDA1 family)